MTIEKKMAWPAQASNEELLRQLISLESSNAYGKNDEDIEITRAEILRRMSK